MATILYVGDEPAVALILEATLERAGHRALSARAVPEALQTLVRVGVDLIISDYRMPGGTGVEFLAMLRGEGFDVPLIMLTKHATIEHAVAAIKAGAAGYVTKPVRPEQLELAIEQALESVRLRRENESLRRELTELRKEQTAPNGTAPGTPAHGAAVAVGHAINLPTLNVAEAERVLIQRALVAAKQNRTRAAELLGISVRTLRNKLNVRGESTAEMAIDGGDGA